MPDYIVTICLPNELPRVCNDDEGIKIVLASVLADEKKDRWYDFMCFANRIPEEGYLDPHSTEGKIQYLTHFDGTAIYRKHAGKLSVVSVSGMFVGLLERLGFVLY